jgi:hypothetical protein
MITDVVDVTVATGTFPNSMEVNEFLDVLNTSGYEKHFAKKPEVNFTGGKHTVTLRIKKYAQWLMMASLDGDGPLEKWGDYFSFSQPIS